MEILLTPLKNELKVLRRYRNMIKLRFSFQSIPITTTTKIIYNMAQNTHTQTHILKHTMEQIFQSVNLLYMIYAIFKFYSILT
jgi:hypothetical protein